MAWLEMQIDTPVRPSIVAVVVTWNPDLAAFEKALRSYSGCCPVVIVDNGSAPAILAGLRKWVSPNCALIECGVNLGIAAAINRGVAAGARWRPEYYFLLDQDSELEVGALDHLMHTSRTLQETGHAPVVGPLPITRDSGQPIGVYQHIDIADQATIQAESLYTSGMLVPANLALEAPQMESFFIDYVDTEWCYRVRHVFGYETYVVPKARIFHQVGDSVLGMKGLRKLPLLVHRPLRQYFQFRNALWMLRLEYIPLRARITMAVRCLARVVVLAFCVAPRLTRVRYIMDAIIDGIRGHAGRGSYLPESARGQRFHSERARSR